MSQTPQRPLHPRPHCRRPWAPPPPPARSRRCTARAPRRSTTRARWRTPASWASWGPPWTSHVAQRRHNAVSGTTPAGMRRRSIHIPGCTRIHMFALPLSPVAITLVFFPGPGPCPQTPRSPRATWLWAQAWWAPTRPWAPRPTAPCRSGKRAPCVPWVGMMPLSHPSNYSSTLLLGLCPRTAGLGLVCKCTYRLVHPSRSRTFTNTAHLTACRCPQQPPRPLLPPRLRGMARDAPVICTGWQCAFSVDRSTVNCPYIKCECPKGCRSGEVLSRAQDCEGIAASSGHVSVCTCGHAARLPSIVLLCPLEVPALAHRHRPFSAL